MERRAQLLVLVALVAAPQQVTTQRSLSQALRPESHRTRTHFGTSFETTLPTVLRKRTEPTLSAETIPEPEEFLVSEVPTPNLIDLSATVAAHRLGAVSYSWTDTRSGDPDIFIQQYSPEGTPLGVNLRVNTDYTSNWQSSPSMAYDSVGSMVVVWQDERHQLGHGETEIYFQRFDPAGNPVGANTRVTEGGGVYSVRPSVATDSSGNFAICWVSAQRLLFSSWDPFELHPYRISFQIFASDGKPLTHPVIVDDTSRGVAPMEPIIRWGSGNRWIVGWSVYRDLETWSGSDVVVRQFRPDGLPLAAPVTVNDVTGSAWLDRRGGIATDRMGNCVVVWEDYHSGTIYGQVFDADLRRRGSNLAISDAISPIRIMASPHIALDPEGNALVIWSSYTPYFEGADVFGQRCGLLMERHGGNFMISSNVADSSFDFGAGVSITTVGIACAFSSNRRAYDSFDVVGKRFSWDWPGVVGVEEGTPQEKPLPIHLSQNYPNPFNPTTTIEYALPHAGLVTLRVYNLLGGEVATLVDGEQPAGTFRADWDASDLPSGVYFYRLTAGDYVQTMKMALMR